MRTGRRHSRCPVSQEAVQDLLFGLAQSVIRSERLLLVHGLFAVQLRDVITFLLKQKEQRLGKVKELHLP